MCRLAAPYVLRSCGLCVHLNVPVVQVWPSIWTKGDDWPNQGEIDIIEGVNLMDYNQMAVHTRAGCSHATGTDETGQALIADCSPASGCTVVCAPGSHLIALLFIMQ